MSNTDKLHVRMLADLCAAYGMRKVVISPGSRNAPLIMAFYNQPEIECYIIPDERSAAYFAMGIAQCSNHPVGLVCTSGTAALNYMPALAEAYYQQLPLVAITADRPPEWIDQGDGQTINQTGIYNNFTIYQTQLPVEAKSRHELWQMERQVRDGFVMSARKSKPIHFNVPLREPLYNIVKQNGTPKASFIHDNFKPVLSNHPLLNELKQYDKIMLVFGMKRPNAVLYGLMEQLAARKDVVVFCENLSNLAVSGVFQMSDTLFSANQGNSMNELIPDIIISFGDMILSKPLKQWIRSLENTKRLVVSQEDQVPDVFQGIDGIINIDTEGFIKSLLATKKDSSTDYVDSWVRAYKAVSKLHKEYTGSVQWSDLEVFKVLSEMVPDNSIVHFGNSSPVRYAQFFNWKKGIQFFGNRGTSGIDGAASTAIGMASQTDKLVTLITGDVGFLYDSNALWNDYKKKNFRIIVINNKGGNIFSLIGGPQSSDIMNKYFATHVPVSIEYLCKAYGIGYYVANNEQESQVSIEALYNDPACALLEVKTDPDVNTRVWKEYFMMIKNKFRYDQETVEKD